MPNPANPADSTSASNGARSGESSVRPSSATSPWNHAATQTDVLEATATTASLPAVGGSKDPFANSEAPTSVRSGSAAARPASAVDQYADLAASAVPAPPTANGAAGFAAGSTAARAAGATPGAAPKVRPAKAIRPPKVAGRTPRRARLQLRHLNVWSVLRFSCVLAVALFFVWLIVVGVLYGVLDVTHVFDKINDTVRQINGQANTKNVVTPGVVFAGAFIIGLVNIVLFIALSTIGSIVYNLCADLVGGIEVTFAEHE